MLEYLELSVVCAIISYVYCELLIKPGHILNVPFEWLKRKLTYKVMVKYDLPEFAQKDGKLYDEIEEERTHWLIKPLGDCSICFSGQLALWSSLFVGCFNPIQIIINISLTIIIIKILNKYV